MDGYDNLVQTLDRFEQSLGTSHPLASVQALAKVSGYSPHHFSRLFASHTDLRLKEYLQARQLASLLHQALPEGRPFAELLACHGFEDYETFYRCCKRRYGKSPSVIRKQGLQEGVLQERIHPARKQETQPLSGEELELDGFLLCGLSFFIGPETRSFHTIWQHFSKHQHLIPSHPGDRASYQYSAWLEDAADGMSVLCSVPVEPGSEQNPLFTLKSIPPCRYVRFIHDQDVTSIPSTYQYIYGTYFAHSETQPLGNWEFQRYPTGEHQIEIYIPIRRQTPLPS
nr:helix-turn-helix domain-containing protein [uncultured Sphaerochaeta sp.]